MEISRLFASWHPALVHFPLGLLFLAIALELFGFFARDRRANWAALVAVTAGTLGLMFSFITGNYAEIVAAHQRIPQIPIGNHEAWATATSWIFIGLVTWRSYLRFENRRGLALYLVAAVTALGLLTITGYKGGQLVYHYAAGVQGVKPPIPPTAQDIANLGLQNSEDELAYSGMMHHVFGWVTLGLALWLSISHFDLPGKKKAQALGPVLLFGSGAFLMIFSDWDAWPLDNRIPVTDPEVLFHKVLATIMMFFGIGMNLARKRRKGDAGALQAHLLAVLALIGGGMLFTHVHTGAPFSQTAMGVYVQHFVIGCLALGCGSVKMLQYLAPQPQLVPERAEPPGTGLNRGEAASGEVEPSEEQVRYVQAPRDPSLGFDWYRFWNLCWIVLLVIVAFNLVTYNEGFPWYLHSPD